MTSTARNGILAGGNWILDRTKIIDVYPAQDALANILAETSCNGGGAYNVLVDLARLQAPFPLAAVGLVGDDSAVLDVVGQARRNGVSVAQYNVMVNWGEQRPELHQRAAIGVDRPDLLT